MEGVKEIYWRVWSEYKDRRGYSRRYSRDFDTLQEGEKGYNVQINKGRFCALFKYTRFNSGHCIAERLKRNW